ncbi:MAG: hypothetical protein K1X35_04770 [Caulobacteraceae bacterium]|nr:hypothetical protein [Caulobacteraceae bacterium]
MAEDDDKIISLDQRRRAEQARQKAEVASAAARRRQANGSGPASFRGAAPAPRPANAPGGGLRRLGRLMAILVYGGLAISIALALAGWLLKG